MVEQNLSRWLMTSQNPSVRYLTLRQLMGKREEDSQVKEARQSMASTGMIPKILAKQNEEGYWYTRHNYYAPKYKSTHWSMLLLTELAVNGEDPRFRRGAKFMLLISRDTSKKAIKMGQINAACFWGNLLRYVTQAGLTYDPQVQQAIDNIVYRALKTNWVCPSCECPCVYGVVRGLWGLAALPEDLRTTKIEKTIQSGLKFLLEDHNVITGPWERFTSKSGITHWQRLNFPDFATSDILFVLRVLAELGELDNHGAQSAVEWLESKRLSNGQWRGASPYKRRTWDGLGDREEINRWVSLHAALILKKTKGL